MLNTKQAADQYVRGFIKACMDAGMTLDQIDEAAAKHSVKVAAELSDFGVPLLATGALGTIIAPYMVGHVAGETAANIRDSQDQHELNRQSAAALARELRRRAAKLRSQNAAVNDVSGSVPP